MPDPIPLPRCAALVTARMSRREHGDQKTALKLALRMMAGDNYPMRGGADRGGAVIIAFAPRSTAPQTGGRA